MPLPWLIGLGAVALGTVVVAALSDDDKPSNNSNNDDEERRRLAAERERKERERNEKKAGIKQDFDKQIHQSYQDVKVSLSDLMIIQGTGKSHLTISNNGTNWSQLASNISTSTYSFSNDVALFIKLYEVDVIPTKKVLNMTKDIDALKKELDFLTQSIKTLS